MASTQQLYELQVELYAGPVTEEFAEKNPRVERTILIRGQQKLADLHDAIFQAFDRWDEHLYEFQIGSKQPMEPRARRYGPRVAIESPFDDGLTIDAEQTTIAMLALKLKQFFWYWFDFGDDWWHKITVAAIHDEVPKGRYPKITQRMGESPPQYIDWDEDEDEDDWEEGDEDME
jgi:hypothetical protein